MFQFFVFWGFFNENPYSKIHVSSTELSEDFKNQKYEKPHVFQICLGDRGTLFPLKRREHSN